MESKLDKQILYFTAEWCGICKKLKPLMKRLSSELPIEFIDVEEDGNVADIFNVEFIPYLILIKGEEIIGSIEGEFDEQKLRNLWNQN